MGKEQVLREQAGSGPGAWNLGVLFGTIYFVQGMAEPGDGLLAQPVRASLKGWGYSAEAISDFAALLALPWALKPLYGLLTDWVPLAGAHRRSYLVVCTGLSAVTLLALALAPPAPGAYLLFLALLLVPSTTVAFTDVVADALMIETGRPRGLTGQLQAVQWAAMYAATLLAGVLGGYLTEQGRDDLAFLICGALALLTLVLALGSVREPPRLRASGGFAHAVGALWREARSPELLGVVGFLFLWSFNPFSNTLLYLYMTEDLHFSEQFFGTTISLLAVGALAGTFVYGFFCRRVPMRRLVHGSIVLGIIMNAVYWLMHDELSALLVSVAAGFCYMTATLIQLDLAARTCAPHLAGTLFALLMGISNLSQALSTWVGGICYEHARQYLGGRPAASLVIGLGALCTAGCWLLWPLLQCNTSFKDT